MVVSARTFTAILPAVAPLCTLPISRAALTCVPLFLEARSGVDVGEGLRKLRIAVIFQPQLVEVVPRRDHKSNLLLVGDAPHLQEINPSNFSAKPLVSRVTKLIKVLSLAYDVSRNRI